MINTIMIYANIDERVTVWCKKHGMVVEDPQDWETLKEAVEKHLREQHES